MSEYESSNGQVPPDRDGDGSRDGGADEAADHTLQEAAEAIIFATDEPVPAHRIGEIVAEVTGRPQPPDGEVKSVIRGLNEAYESEGRPFEIKKWAGGYRMVTRSSVSPFVKTLYLEEQETSLSRSLMETLAVIAYRQPVTRPEVDFVRGVNSDYAIRRLLDMDLACVEGRADSVGRPLLYGTTDRFLEQFGLDQLDDLPTLRQVEDLLDDPAFDDERAKLLQLDREEGITIDLFDEDDFEEEPEPGEEGQE